MHQAAAAAAAAAAQRAEGLRMVDVAHGLRPATTTTAAAAAAAATGRFHHHHRGGGGRGMPVYQIPRVPLHYPYALPQVQPMYAAHPHAGYYMMPEDPRLAALYPYGASSAAHHPHPQLRGPITGPHSHLHRAHFHQGAPLQVHPSLQPHPSSSSSSPSGAGGLSPQGRSTPGEEGQPDSLSSPELSQPGSSSAGAGQGFQVLPNVKHVPAHLMRGGLQPVSSQASSRSSTPVHPDRGPMAVPSHLAEARSGTPVSDRPYSPANYAAHSSPVMSEAHHHDRSSSRERELNMEASEMSSHFVALQVAGGGGSGESSPQEPQLTPPVAPTTTTTTTTVPTTTTRKTNNPKQLRLKTGFSRQFSDDLPTPTAITEIVRMIEENIEEGSENSDSSPTSSSSPILHRAQIIQARLNGRNAALSSLQLDLGAAQQRQSHMAGMNMGGGPTIIHGSNNNSSGTPSSSDSPAALNGERPTYAGIVGKPHMQGQGGLMPDLSQLEPQTPRTPTGFTTPGADPHMDPYGILKSLNIEAPPMEHMMTSSDMGAFP